MKPRPPALRFFKMPEETPETYMVVASYSRYIGKVSRHEKQWVNDKQPRVYVTRLQAGRALL